VAWCFEVLLPLRLGARCNSPPSSFYPASLRFLPPLAALGGLLYVADATARLSPCWEVLLYE